MSVIDTMPGLEDLREDLGEIELKVLTEGVTLAGLIREGGQYVEQNRGGFVSNDRRSACALSTAAMAARARNLA